MQKTELLMLVECKVIHFTDKNTGDPVKKWKYTFLNEKNEFFTGYLDSDEYKKYLVDDSVFDPKKAKSILLHGSVWQNVVSWRLGSSVGIGK